MIPADPTQPVHSQSAALLSCGLHSREKMQTVPPAAVHPLLLVAKLHYNNIQIPGNCISTPKLPNERRKNNWHFSSRTPHTDRYTAVEHTTKNQSVFVRLRDVLIFSLLQSHYGTRAPALEPTLRILANANWTRQISRL
ncbi:unnamed protein product, partial [Ectocarpus sp. 8 AP-2014]